MSGRLLTGLTLVVIGALLLMNTTGNLPWTLWQSALEFWPVLIIGLGLQVVLSKWRVPGLAIALLVMLILGAMNPHTNGNLLRRFGFPVSSPLKKTRELSIPMKPTVSGLDLNLEGAVLALQVSGVRGVDAGDLALRVDLQWNEDEPSVQGSAEGQIRSMFVSAPVSPSFGDRGKQNWGFSVNSSLVTSLKVTGEVIDLDLDCNDLYVESLYVKAGVCDVSFDMGLSGQESKVVVDGGVGKMKLTVPERAGVRIAISSPSLVSHDFTTRGLTKSGNVWSTPDYAAASTKLDLSVTAGVSKVQLTRK